MTRTTMRKKKPTRRTPEERAAEQANRRELEERIGAITAELERAGSAYTSVGSDEQLVYAIGRIDAELASKR
jgi:hypothetical protein